MDADHFDRLARSLTTSPTRRGVTRALAGLTLAGALAPLLSLTDTAAKKRRKKGKGRKKKGGKPSPPLTCGDGIKNGSESDIDCGGNCPRCAHGQGCGSRNDCASAFCTSGACQSCGASADCPDDGNGACRCGSLTTGGLACYTPPSPGPGGNNCALCPAGTACFFGASIGTIFCAKPCGAA
jgi:hypothetical protein